MEPVKRETIEERRGAPPPAQKTPGRRRDGECRHCGLPTPPKEVFCCYGCELAAQIAAEGAEEHGHLHARLLFSVLLTMSVMMLSLFLYAEDIYGISAADGMAWMRNAYRIASAVLATPVVLLCGIPLARRSWQRLRRRRLSMEALILTAALAAYLRSLQALFTGSHAVFFDSATAALVLATFGRYLEATARSRAGRLLAPTLDPTRERVAWIDAQGRHQEIDPGRIEPGMRLEIGLEQRVPVDLRVEGEGTEVDLGVLTGESLPVRRVAGDFVPAGAVPISGPLRGRALRSARESTLEALSRLAEAMQADPSRLQRLADRFATFLTPIVLLVAWGTFITWSHLDATGRGIVTALSVLLVACPCTYAIAAPLVFSIALRRALAQGVLIRNAETIEQLTRIDRVAFDKTGTLTSEELTVERMRVAEGVRREEVLALVAALEAGSRHPVARALQRMAAGVPPAPLQERRFLPGRGVEGRDIHGHHVAVGPDTSTATPQERGPDGEMLHLCLRRAGKPLAHFEIGETLRPEAKGAIDELRGQGVEPFILTGDASPRAQMIAERLGIPLHAGQTPEGKLRLLEAAGAGCAMVGDGLNDAPALARAGVGFAMTGGTPLARGLADVVLLHPDLRLVPRTIALARKVVRTVGRMLVAATLYNVVFISLAAAGMLRPLFAGMSMLASSLLTLSFALASLRETNRC